ncbi:hypothetical protein GCM10027404_22590 [Arthrobacter tumbae]|nr:peptidoglycan hydrolase-like protein with peptidoglycan-binding domain [Arthrobacter tumbae]
MAYTSLNKKIQDGELATIASQGLSVFPIYQTYGGEANYFSEEQGFSDGLAAIARARSYGFRSGTRIYFAVDFDALDYQITDNVIPHFQGITNAITTYGPQYDVGIYGPRNACSRVSIQGLASASFVSDMSTGFSGNLGYPLPTNWAFDQISTIGVGTGSGYIEIDNNIASGLDVGQRAFDPAPLFEYPDVSFNLAHRDSLLADLQTYLEGIGVPEQGGETPAEAGTYFINTTTEAFDKVLEFDDLVTQLARTLKLRKALIQTPLFWEIRKSNVDEPPADALVRSYYAGTGGIDDSSTGIGQIKAKTAINSRNTCIDEGIVYGSKKSADLPNDVWEEWQLLNESETHNVAHRN